MTTNEDVAEKIYQTCYPKASVY